MNQGFHRAIVRDNNDPEKLGKIRVEYPWFQGDSSAHPSEWAAFCSPYASSQSGFWFLPEVGDEVLVFLENGNLDHPVILGSLYSKKHAPPASGKSGDFNADGKNDLKFISTRSGHLLCFDDAEGSITIRNKQGDQIVMESSGIRIQSKNVKIEAAASVEIGEGASEALLKGNAFMTYFNTHTHTSGGPGSPTSPPVAPMTPDMLSMKVKTA